MACGVLGVVLKEESEKLGDYANIGLNVLNHRGENSHGLSFLKADGTIETRKSMGLVRDSSSEVDKEKIGSVAKTIWAGATQDEINRLVEGVTESKIFSRPISGRILIGHTRYVTSSTSGIENAQPIEFELESGVKAAISHNGNIGNDKELRRLFGIKEEGTSDTKTLGILLGRSLRKENEIDSIREVLSQVVGSYSITLLIPGENPRLMALRDPMGYMPLSVGRNREGFFVASESVAFGNKYLNGNSRSIEPGELIMIDRKGITSHKLFEQKESQFCMFQFVYMCRPETVVMGKNVHTVRTQFGAEIAKHYRPAVDILVPIMESGFPITLGYSQATGIPMDMGVSKDRYKSDRSFMQNEQENRERTARKKLNVIPEVVRDKRVLLMDDSVVRGTTMKELVAEVWKAGAMEVHLAVSCPPIVSQCDYGIDFYNEQLLARPLKGKSNEEIDREVAKIIGVDSLYYQRIDGLAAAIGLPKEELCTSCLTGVYKQPVNFVSEGERKR